MYEHIYHYEENELASLGCCDDEKCPDCGEIMEKVPHEIYFYCECCDKCHGAAEPSWNDYSIDY